MDKQFGICALYIVEHPDHLCQHSLFPLEEEKEGVRWAQAEGIWLEKLGEISGSSEGYFDSFEMGDLTRRCSRPMLFLSDVDAGLLSPGRLCLQTSRTRRSWRQVVRPQNISSSPAFLRFGPHPTELVFPGYERDAAPREILSAALYMRETIPPICTLMTDYEYNFGLFEYLWSEKLGYVQAEVDRNDSLNVRPEHINELVRSCSRQMLLVSVCMPPMYIPRTSLQRLVQEYEFGCVSKSVALH